jgi:CDP-6-deoxy-D-xylo-4-hexulose-3-dehydrase
MTKPDADALRRDILEKVRAYHAAAFGERPPFEPGTSKVDYAGRVFDESELVNLVDSSLDFWLTYGRWSERFEEGLAAFIGVKHALLVNSGSSANLLAFAALTSETLGERAVRRGDEVITVAAGFPTTVAPIVQFGAVPVFVDVDPATANARVADVEAAITPRTRAVMLAHTLGNPFAAREMRELCDARDLWLVEDNCDALGSRYEGRLTGTFGHIGASSFYPAHHMTMGEGGAVYTNDDALAKVLLSMRDWGRDCWCASGRDNTCGKRFTQQFGTLPFGYDHKYVYSEFGYNLKATDMQAAIGCAQLEKMPGFCETRRRNHAWLRKALAPLESVLAFQEATPGADPSWFGFLITVREGAAYEDGTSITRDGLVRALEGARVQTRALFAGNLTRHPCFDGMRERDRGYRIVGDLTNTDRIMRDSLWVGVYPGMSEEMLGHVATTVTAAVTRG